MSKIRQTQILQNRYKLIDTIGHGGMAEVYLVEDLHLHKKWAMKCIDLTIDTEWRLQSFMVEMDFLRCISHPAFPMLVDSFVENNVCFLVMEYIAGETLKDYLAREKNMKLAEATKLIREIMEALMYLHNHTPTIVYGDLKPANIMIENGRRGRILDFGSVVWGEQRFVMGTPEYAAPEQISDEYDDIDERSDIYTVGLIFAEMLTGQKISAGMYIENPLLPRWVREFVMRCTRINPRERFQTMEEAIEALERKQTRARKRPQFILQDLERVVLSECNQSISGQNSNVDQNRMK